MNYILYALLGAIFLSISDIASKYAIDNKISNVTYITWSHGVLYFVVLIIFIILCLKYQWKTFMLHNEETNSRSKTLYDILKLPNDWKSIVSVILGGIFGFLALIIIIMAFQRSVNIGYTVAVISSTSAITAILTWLLFKVKLNVFGVIGIGLIISGCFLIGKSENDFSSVAEGVAEGVA